MASMVAWLIGLLFFGIGCWILLLRFEGLVDRVRPHTMSIGQMTVDGTDSRGHAELLRARFDHHFRQSVVIPRDTGFLEVVSLDSAELFQQRGLETVREKVTLDVSGVDVATLVRFVNQLAKPDQWLVEGDFQTQSDRALLALRLRRGDRLIRTWYLERLGNPSTDRSILLERLIDDAIFQLVYDFGNDAEDDPDLRKWRRVVPAPTNFPSPAAVAAYYEARGSFGRYYAHGDWSDLDRAIEGLQTLRAQMPEYADGLQLLAMALAEKRNETEAIHVYEQLRSVLLPKEEDWERLSPQDKRRLLAVDLLRATATAKLYTWQSAHESIRELTRLNDALRDESAAAQTDAERAALTELRAQTAIQLAYTYALYFSYISHYTVGEIFGSPDAPDALRISDGAELTVLRDGPPDEAKRIVREVMRKIAIEHKTWIATAQQQQAALETKWGTLVDGERRKGELVARLHLASGYANYRMAELERHDAAQEETVFDEPFDTRLKDATSALRTADAAHPNHYLVLQLLGLVYSEPRRDGAYLNIAEQYFERAIRANPSDYYGHELLAGILLRRVGNVGIDLASRPTIERGLAEAQAAVVHREVSGAAHLLRAQFQTLLLELERSEPKRRELRAGLDQYLDQAERFLPRVFGRPDVDLAWVRIAAAARQLGENADGTPNPQRFRRSKQELATMIEELIADCNRLEQRWVANQRVFQIKSLSRRAQRLGDQINRATIENWREIQIPFL
jgi:hypothetical protein